MTQPHGATVAAGAAFPQPDVTVCYSQQHLPDKGRAAESSSAAPAKAGAQTPGPDDSTSRISPDRCEQTTRRPVTHDSAAFTGRDWSDRKSCRGPVKSRHTQPRAHAATGKGLHTQACQCSQHIKSRHTQHRAHPAQGRPGTGQTFSPDETKPLASASQHCVHRRSARPSHPPHNGPRTELLDHERL